MTRGDRDPVSELFFGSLSDLPGMHLDPDELDALIEERGVGCLFRVAIPCPCVRPDTGSARSGCRACAGLGQAYPSDLERSTIAVVVSRSPKRALSPPGTLITGTCVITFPTSIVPGAFDMVCPDGEVHVVKEQLVRASAQVDLGVVRDREAARDQLAPDQPPATERILYREVQKLETVHWLDDNEELRSGEAGRDYTLKAGVITWKRDRGPNPGRMYSVRYQAPAAYVLNPAEPVVRLEGGKRMPYRCEGQRLDRWAQRDLGTGAS